MEKSNKEIFFVPLLGILWVNIHGGSSNLSYLLCLFFLIAGVINFEFGKISFARLEKNNCCKGASTLLVILLALLLLIVLALLALPVCRVSQDLSARKQRRPHCNVVLAFVLFGHG